MRNKDSFGDVSILAVTSGGITVLSGLTLIVLTLFAGANRVIYSETAYIICGIITVVGVVGDGCFLFYLVKSSKTPFPVSDMTDLARMFEQSSRARQQERKEDMPMPVQPIVVGSGGKDEGVDLSPQIFAARDRANRLLNSSGANGDKPKMLQ